MDIIRVPWTTEQVEALNTHQTCGLYHGYTCGNNSSHKLLLATPSGWVCPDCDYRQNWAHDPFDGDWIGVTSLQLGDG